MEKAVQAENTGTGQPSRLRGYIDRIPTDGAGRPRSFAIISAEDGTEVFLHRRAVAPMHQFRKGVLFEFSLQPPLKNGQLPIAVGVQVIG